MKFEDWWNRDGARTYAPTHEDRARHAFEAGRAVGRLDFKEALKDVDSVMIMRGLACAMRTGRVRLSIDKTWRQLRVVMLPLMRKQP